MIVQDQRKNEWAGNMSAHCYLENHRKLGKQNLQLRDIEGTRNTKTEVIRIVKDGKRVEKNIWIAMTENFQFLWQKGKH